ncbi:tripartite-type tricarboxylate transporter receptor subunit TctC [Sphaerotilus hippei]|uniref:Tripartite-type tricarboxylate transporter receptor subunit TctC n=1 Tax=Sphaerotilus hippei TaxID=744406 RepID=A0A318H409_9BURK|nr:Bug family tripartite tricarboxylate transporter substrate binding protein [Sphaerotilus hippei]PXW97654.1 tripartite-type tricarboxylate transporter receptor subunit TctC [Sphaerotilus hippei]
MIDRRHFMIAAAGAATAGWHLPGLAQQVDTNRVLCGFPAGGTTDAVSRRVSEKLRSGFARVSLVENKPGAGGRLAVEELKRSAPDGSTLLMTPAGMITLYPHIYTRLTYGIQDVTPVCTAGTVGFAFAVGPMVPESVRTLRDYLAWAKAHPDRASYGSPGAGTTPHFVGALLAKESGVELNHVPYRGSAPGVQDLLGGQLPAMSSPIGDYLPHLRSGKVRVLATSGAKRSRFLPDVPTYTEQGFKALEMVEWYGFFLPPKAPADVVERAAQAIRAAVQSPDVIDGFAALGIEAGANTPAEMSRAVREETVQWQQIVKRVGFVPEA